MKNRKVKIMYVFKCCLLLINDEMNNICFLSVFILVLWKRRGDCDWVYLYFNIYG